MSGWFNPANPRFRRGVVLTSIVACSFATCQIVLADFGSQEHVLSPVQRMIIPKVDEFFGVTSDDLQVDPATTKDTGFIRVVSPLMPNSKKIKQIDNNNAVNGIDSKKVSIESNSNSNSSSSSSSSSNIELKKEVKRGWLW